jgi:hypothetical protein
VKPAYELLCSVGATENAGGDDLLAARALARLLGERDEQVEAGADRKGQAESDRALRTGGERCLGRDLHVRPVIEGRAESRHVVIIC